jgi:gluconokinase
MSTYKVNLPVVAAIDIGTTSAKGLLIQSNGNVLASKQEFYETSFPQPGYAEQDPDLILQSVFGILKSITPNQIISGVCFSSAMHSLMALDKNGKPLTPLMIWSDTRSAEQSGRLIENNLAQRLYEITGTQVHPMSPLCKLLWIKQHQSEIFISSFKFVSIKEYILFHLTGDFIVDHSIASATGLFDLDRRQWSTLALELIGVTEEKFSRPVPVHTALKVTKKNISELGLDGTPLIVGASDGCLAQLGSHAMNKNDLSITIGTSGAVRTASNKRSIDPQGRIFNYILDNDNFVCGGATNNGTALLNWYTNNMDSSASDDLMRFVDQVMEIQPGCDGLLMIPYLLGERAPIYNPNARGVFFGVSIDHTKKHFQRALIEGICFQIRWSMEGVEELFGEREKILISGGFTRSEKWIQILCDVLGKTLTLQETQDASTMGAAMMGFKALAIKSEFVLQASKLFYPDPELHKVYTKSYLTFRKLYSAVEKIY